MEGAWLPCCLFCAWVRNGKQFTFISSGLTWGREVGMVEPQGPGRATPSVLGSGWRDLLIPPWNLEVLNGCICSHVLQELQVCRSKLKFCWPGISIKISHEAEKLSPLHCSDCGVCSWLLETQPSPLLRVPQSFQKTAFLVTWLASLPRLVVKLWSWAVVYPAMAMGCGYGFWVFCQYRMWGETAQFHSKKTPEFSAQKSVHLGFSSVWHLYRD